MVKSSKHAASEAVEEEQGRVPWARSVEHVAQLAWSDRRLAPAMALGSSTMQWQVKWSCRKLGGALCSERRQVYGDERIEAYVAVRGLGVLDVSPQRPKEPSVSFTLCLACPG